MANRRKGRELALQALYQIDMLDENNRSLIERLNESFYPAEELNSFSMELIEGVLTHVKEIDVLIEKYSENWKLSRMPLVDRNILRIAVFELLHKEDIPVKVTLNEAIEIGKKYGSESTGSFVNGILDKIAKTVKKD
jgi:transcription antitermination protein NusB